MGFKSLSHVDEKRSGVGSAHVNAIPAILLLLPTALLHYCTMHGCKSRNWDLGIVVGGIDVDAAIVHESGSFRPYNSGGTSCK